MTGLSVPWWFAILFWGVIYWQVTLAVCFLSLIAAFVTRGLVRAGAIALTIVFLVVLGVATVWQRQAAAEERETAAFEARIHETLDKPFTVDGLDLPADTEVQWSDESRRHLRSASFPAPTRLLGVRFIFLAASDDGEGWTGQIAAPQSIEGWTCGEDGNVKMSASGRLRSCRLARGRDWKGWPIPAGSLLEFGFGDGLVGLSLPTGSSLTAPEIGHAILPTGEFRFNADGSLHDVYFEPEDPLILHGIALWNTVAWSYEPGSLGQGRSRPAVTVTGALTRAAADSGGPGGSVSIRLSDGRVTRVD